MREPDPVPPVKRDIRDSWFELFYDVVLAAALASMHDAFLMKFSLQTALVTGTVAAMVFTIWVMSSLLFNRFPGPQPFRRVILTVQMAALVIVALAADVGGPVTVQTGVIAYAIALLTVAILYWQAPGARDEARVRGTRLLVLVLLGEVVVVALTVLLPLDFAWAVLLLTCFTAFLALYLASGPQLDRVHPIDAEHLADRMGNFLVIVIGMGFAQLVLDVEGEVGVQDWRFFGLIFVLMFALWSMYFRLDLNTPRFASLPGRFIWIGSHYLILIGIVGMNDVLSALAADATTTRPLASIAFTGLMLAMSLVGFALLIILRGVLTPKQGSALVVVALIVAISSMVSESIGNHDLRVVAQVMVGVLVACAIALDLVSRRSATPPTEGRPRFRMLEKP